MAQKTNQSQAPLLCSTGCGFYGNPRNNGMCSVCYKDFLQRQNSNGCVSPSGSSTGSSMGESLLTQCSNSATVMSPAAVSPADAQSGHYSGPTPASTTSTEESTSGTKTGLKGDSLQSSCMSGSAAAVGSKQEGQCSTGSSGTLSSTQRNVLMNSTAAKKCSNKSRKRKLEEPYENVDVNWASASEVSMYTPAETEEKPKAMKNRCFMCCKKVGLTGFDCRCGNTFCSIHRYSDIHKCTFDYKADAAEKIRKENPVIVGEKIQRI